MRTPDFRVALLSALLGLCGLSLAAQSWDLRWEVPFPKGQNLPQTLLAGEWVFTGCLYPEGEGPRAGFVHDVLERYWLLPSADVDAVLAAREAAPAFLEECFDAVPWARYAVAGFTSCGAQNVAAVSSQFGAWNATGSPACTPAARNPPATFRARSDASA